MSETEGLSEAKRRVLEKYIRGELVLTAKRSRTIPRRPFGEPAPLSFAQEQLWLRTQTVGIPPLYNESITVRRIGPLNVNLLEQSLAEIVRRHEIWRTSYETSSESPVQRIHPAPSTYPLQVVDLCRFPEGRREQEASRLTTEEAQRPFDLIRGPLLRTILFRMSDTDHRLSITAHLSIVDGVSVYQVFPSELTALYEAFAAGRPSPLLEPSIQYADYAYWQRRSLQGELLTRQLVYWRKQLAGQLPVLQWPTDHPRPAVQTFRGSIRPFALPERLTQCVKELSLCERVTLFTTLQAGFTALLHRYTSQDEIIIGTLSPSGRKRSELQGLLGHFLNPVALRISMVGDPQFRELLRHTQQVTSEAISHDDVPVELLAEELLTKRDTSRNPFFTVAVSLQPSMPNIGSRWEVTSMDADSGGAMWDLYLAFIERSAGMVGRMQYNPDLFEVATISRMVEDLQSVLTAAAANPYQRISELQLSS